MKNEPHDCKEMLRNISDYVDGELDEGFCEELQKHIHECDDCRIVVNTMKKTIDLYQSAKDDELPADVKERLYLRLNLSDYLKSSG